MNTNVECTLFFERTLRMSRLTKWTIRIIKWTRDRFRFASHEKTHEGLSYERFPFSENRVLALFVTTGKSLHLFCNEIKKALQLIISSLKLRLILLFMLFLLESKVLYPVLYWYWQFDELWYSILDSNPVHFSWISPVYLGASQPSDLKWVFFYFFLKHSFQSEQSKIFLDGSNAPNESN